MFYLIKNGVIEGSSTNLLTQEGYNTIVAFFSEDDIKKLDNGAIFINGLIETNTDKYNQYMVNKELRELVEMEKKVHKIEGALTHCSSNKNLGTCPEHRKKRLELQESNLNSKRDSAENIRNDKLDAIIEEFSDGTTEGDQTIVDLFNDMLIGDI